MGRVKKFLINGTLAFSVVSMATLATSCGTLMHPERKGQTEGQLDSRIVIFDAIGLLFFIIPGAIAFYVDFDNGTIYLPQDGSVMTEGQDKSEMVAIKFDKENASNEELERIIAAHTGNKVDLNDKQVKIITIK